MEPGLVWFAERLYTERSWRSDDLPPYRISKLAGQAEEGRLAHFVVVV